MSNIHKALYEVGAATTAKKHYQELSIARHVSEILDLLGEDIEREGIKETPLRVARAWLDMLSSTELTNQDIADKVNKSFEFEDSKVLDENIVIVKDIEIFSMCEHHMALMYNMKVAIAYKPKGRVLGLSKLARIADLVSKRLQLQEKIGTDIAEVMKICTETDDIMVVIDGSHSCMSARGICKPGATTRTIYKSGRFLTQCRADEVLKSL